MPRIPTLAVRFGEILDEPVDGVVCVGRVIDLRRIQRPNQRPGHDVVALGAVLAAHILHDSDVAAIQDGIGGGVVVVDERREVRAWTARNSSRRAVRSTGQEYRCTVRSARNDGMTVLSLDAVASFAIITSRFV